jgi:clan AA aspartic protease (TIGR02281 family)
MRCVRMSDMKLFSGSIALALALWMVSRPGLAADFYRWVDDKGIVHFTDNIHNIPENRRGTAKRIQGNEGSGHQPPPAAPPTKASIPFEKHGSVVIVQATLNGKAAVKLVLDTGASFTMISSATAKQLDIDASQAERTMPFQTANGMIQAPLISLDSISVAGLELKNLTAAVHDAMPDPGVAGLLGLNFLTNFRMDIDTEKGIVHLEKK